MTEHLNNFATTVQEKVTKATIIQPNMAVKDAVAEYCVSSGYVLIRDTANDRALAAR